MFGKTKNKEIPQIKNIKLHKTNCFKVAVLKETVLRSIKIGCNIKQYYKYYNEMLQGTF